MMYSYPRDSDNPGIISLEGARYLLQCDYDPG